MADMSIVEEKLCSSDFSYLQPYFYRHPYALRCELGIGDTDERYLSNARRRAMEIYNILFPHGADAVIFNVWLYDYCDSGEAESAQYDSEEEWRETVEYRIQCESERLRFVSEYQMKYRHRAIRNLETYDPEEESNRRIRMICYADDVEFAYQELLDRQLEGRGYDISFVSFANECIFSVYDDRGCDVVFMTHEKMKAFYPLLQPYFLEYDAEEMQKRYHG